MRASLLILAALLFSAPAGAKSIDDLYARIVSDANAGLPVVVTVHVALCDAFSQNLLVKSEKICNGDRPESNLYWATSGGLRKVMEKSPFKSVLYEKQDEGVLAARGVWHRRFPASKGLEAKGLTSGVAVYVVGLAYRGSRIEDAMRDYLRAVGHDVGDSLDLPGGETIGIGGQAHVVGYIGHNHLMNVNDQDSVLSEADGEGKLHRGVFALSCLSDSYLRETVDRPSTHIMVMNRDYTYPGAWTVLGIVQALMKGKDHKGIHLMASKFFADGKGKPLGAILKAFASGG
jgi:hypothetical protein